MIMNGILWDLEILCVFGSYNIFSDIRCKFFCFYLKRLILFFICFIFGYKIVVSNNNKNFSEVYVVYILDLIC